MNSSDKLNFQILTASERLRKLEAAIEDVEKVARQPGLEVPRSEYLAEAELMRKEAAALREAIDRLKKIRGNRG